MNTGRAFENSTGVKFAPSETGGGRLKFAPGYSLLLIYGLNSHLTHPFS